MGNDRRPGDPGFRFDHEFDERAIDRRLLGLLIARYGDPARRRRPLTLDEEERQVLALRRDRALESVKPRLLQHVERHNRVAARPTVSHAAAARAADGALSGRTPIGLDWDTLRLRNLGDLRELEPSDELRDCLHHRTPQAFLRDLHRPVQHFGDVQLRRRPAQTPAGTLARARAIVRETMSQTARGAGSISRASQQGMDGLRELREILARPWADSRPEKPLPMASVSPGVSDWQWFGVSGGYDPDV